MKNIISKLDLYDEKKILNAKTIEEFLDEISERFERNNKVKLEYQEFFSLCFLGFPHKYRKKMWKIFIGNDLYRRFLRTGSFSRRRCTR